MLTRTCKRGFSEESDMSQHIMTMKYPIQAYSSVNYVCLWCKNLKQRPWKNIRVRLQKEIWMHSCLQLEFSGIIILLSSENNTVMLISPSHGHADHHSTLIWWCGTMNYSKRRTINQRGIFTRAKDRDCIWSEVYAFYCTEAS